MTRSTKVCKKNHRHKKILSMAKGYRGRSKNCYRPALQRVEKALQYQFRDRRNRKRDFRRLWIQRINAAVRECGLKYSIFIRFIQDMYPTLDRKILAAMAVEQKEAFQLLAQAVKDRMAASV